MSAKSKLDIRYTAGLLDGEGCIGAYKNFEKRDISKGWNPSYSLMVQITNTHKPVIVQLQKQYGGWFGKQIFADHRKTIFIWKLHSKQAKRFLLLILPYLQIKKKEAKLAIKYQTTLSRGTGGQNHFLPSKEMKRRDQIIRKLKQLKRRQYV